MSEQAFEVVNPTDKTKLHGKSWAVENPTAILHLVHGLGEHIGRYAHMADWLNQQNICLSGIDLRGHGKSDGKRGVCRKLDLMLDDIGASIAHKQAQWPNVPQFLMGHSMGGLLVLEYSRTRSVDGFKGIISQAPALEPASPPSAIFLGILKLLRPIMPAFTAANGLNADDISSDPAVNEAYKNDTLVHDQIGIGLAIDMIETGRRLMRNPPQLPVPLLMAHGTEDRITSMSATSDFAERSGANAELYLVPGGYHEIHNDPEHKKLFEFVQGWMSQRL